MSQNIIKKCVTTRVLDAQIVISGTITILQNVVKTVQSVTVVQPFVQVAPCATNARMLTRARIVANVQTVTRCVQCVTYVHNVKMQSIAPSVIHARTVIVQYAPRVNDVNSARKMTSNVPPVVVVPLVCKDFYDAIRKNVLHLAKLTHKLL